MAFSPPEYCRLFAQKKAYQVGVTGTPGPPLATPLIIGILIDIVENSKSGIGCYKDWRVGLQIYNRYRNVDRRILIL